MKKIRAIVVLVTCSICKGRKRLPVPDSPYGETKNCWSCGGSGLETEYASPAQLRRLMQQS